MQHDVRVVLEKDVNDCLANIYDRIRVAMLKGKTQVNTRMPPLPVIKLVCKTLEQEGFILRYKEVEWTRGGINYVEDAFNITWIAIE